MVILITGTRKGIGNAIANHYLELGHIVIGCSRKDSEFQHQNYRHHSIDISDEKAVCSMIHTTVNEFGKIDALINNAGVASMNHLLLTPQKTVEQVMGTNFFGTFFVLRETAKQMIRNKYGRIVNFTTVAVPLSLEGEAVYAASKAAVESLTRVASRELSPYGITVNAVGPTPVQTDLIKLVPKEKINKLIESQAIHQMGTAEDVINVVDFFLSEKSSFVTGQIIYLGGIN